jgi:hypothetical protein
VTRRLTKQRAGKESTESKITATRRNLVKLAKSQPGASKVNRGRRKPHEEDRAADTPVQAVGRAIGKMMDNVNDFLEDEGD